MSNSKTRLKVAIATLCVALALPMLAQAERLDGERIRAGQGPRGSKHEGRRGPDPGHFIDRHGDELGLDAETRAAIQAIADASREESAQARDAIRPQHEAMRALLSQPMPDEAAVISQHDRIEALKSDQRKIRLEAMLAIRKLLTPEQREQLVDMRGERRQDGGECRACSDEAGPCRGDCPRKGRHGSLAGCRSDVAKLCSESEPGRARLQCLDAEWENLSDDCRAAFEGRGRRGGRPDRCTESSTE
jgi:Spy/CpxP family protein refolding chaperone